MYFDLHVHTAISSCSRLDIGYVLAHAREAGLDGVCITDHQTMAIRHHVREGIQPDGLCLIFGMEYSTPDGDFLVFGPFEGMPKNLSATDLLRAVETDGGIAIAAHPFRKVRPVSESVIRDGLCHTVESINGRNKPSENFQVDCWLQQYALTECGGSDAHTPEELGKIRTRFSVPVCSRSDLIYALKNGLCEPEDKAWLFNGTSCHTSFSDTPDRELCLNHTM